MEQRATDLAQQQELFEVQSTPFREIKKCRQDLLWLKTVWDHVQFALDIFQSFRATLWNAVDIEKMSETTRKIQKECKLLPRQTANWSVNKELMLVILESASRCRLSIRTRSPQTSN
eukprot:2570526-Prymnesium_polylepis.1